MAPTHVVVDSYGDADFLAIGRAEPQKARVSAPRHDELVPVGYLCPGVVGIACFIDYGEGGGAVAVVDADAVCMR